MQSSVVITVVGPDRPGLVESVSRVVESHSGNWTHSRMAHLGGQFAGMLLVQAEASHVEELVNSLRALESEGLTIAAVSEPSAGTAAATTDGQRDGEVVGLELVGQDRAGIVRHIASAIAARGANIEDLATECYSAPMSGESMFRAKARIHLPAGVEVTSIQQDLEAIATDLMVDVTFEAE